MKRRPKAEQPALLMLPPKPPTRFELESRRRGAPFEVQGKRRRARSQAEDLGPQTPEDRANLAHLNELTQGIAKPL